MTGNFRRESRGQDTCAVPRRRHLSAGPARLLCNLGRHNLCLDSGASFMASYEEERALTQNLIEALTLPAVEYSDPHANGAPECGIDVVFRVGGKLHGVQVTTPDFGIVAGADRAAEAKLSRASSGGSYFTWANANPEVAYGAFASAIERKAAIASRHDFSGYDETWLLLVCGVPTTGAISTLLPPWIDTDELDQGTNVALQSVKYTRAYIHSQLDVTQRLWMWTRWDGRWIKLQ
jgi:hypothetical protein